VLHVPNTSSCQLATGSPPLLVTAAAAADDDDDASFVACVADSTDDDDLASDDAELQDKFKFCFKKFNLVINLFCNNDKNLAKLPSTTCCK